MNINYSCGGGPPPPPPGPPPPPPGGPPVPPMLAQYQYPPVPPPFYTWGTSPAPPAPSSTAPPPGPPIPPSPLQPQQRPTIRPSYPTQSPAVVPPIKPGKDVDFTQHALDTVVAAAGAVASQARANNPDLRESPHIRTGLAGVKRKGLASELLAFKSDSYHVGWTNLWDTVMPAELMAKCKPLHCELCSCQATSPVQAKMHYEGKTHDKNVRTFFQNWTGNTRHVVPQKLIPSDKKPKPSQAVNNPNLYCNVCDLYFTSQVQLDQHIQGKNHLKKASCDEDQSQFKTSFYNRETHQWLKYDQSEDESTSVSSPTTITAPSSLDPNFNKFYCDLCKVGAPSQPQMDMHLNGKNHKAKMKKNMGGLANDDLNAISKRVKLKGDILATMTKNKSNPPQNLTKRKDYSAYRTPSGQYYCAACNVSLNSDSQFGQHQASKKHKQKAIAQRSRNI